MKKSVAKMADEEAARLMKVWLEHDAAHGCEQERGHVGCVLGERMWINFRETRDLAVSLRPDPAKESESRGTDGGTT